jgi:BlaI family transcriptional regulator, penicillinase repressor
MTPEELDVPDAELAVLRALWQQGPSTIRQLVDVVYPGGGAAKYGTVQKLLERLEERTLVRRDRTPWPHVFCATVERETLIGHRLRTTAEKLCGGSLTPLLLHLLRAEQFSDEERQELRAFLEQLRKNNKAGHPGP